MRLHFWNTMWAIAFVACAVFGYEWLSATERLSTWVPITDFFLMTLAVMRLVGLVTYDVIMQFVRDWFFEETTVGVCPKSGFKASVGHLLG